MYVKLVAALIIPRDKQLVISNGSASGGRETAQNLVNAKAGFESILSSNRLVEELSSHANEADANWAESPSWASPPTFPRPPKLFPLPSLEPISRPELKTKKRKREHADTDALVPQETFPPSSAEHFYLLLLSTITTITTFLATLIPLLQQHTLKNSNSNKLELIQQQHAKLEQIQLELSKAQQDK